MSWNDCDKEDKGSKNYPDMWKFDCGIDIVYCRWEFVATVCNLMRLCRYLNRNVAEVALRTIEGKIAMVPEIPPIIDLFTFLVLRKK